MLEYFNKISLNVCESFSEAFDKETTTSIGWRVCLVILSNNLLKTSKSRGIHGIPTPIVKCLLSKIFCVFSILSGIFLLSNLSKTY